MSAEDPEQQNERNEESTGNDYYYFSIKSCNMSLNLTYMKSIIGICNALEVVFSLCGLISIAAGFQPTCDFRYGSSYGFYDFVGASVFVSRLIIYVLFVVSFEEKWCLKFVPWLVVRVIVLGVYSIFFLIASIAVAANTCYQDGYKVAAAFGFIVTTIIIVDCVFSWLKLRSEHPPTNNRILILMGVEVQPPSQPQTSDTAVQDPVMDEPPKY